MSINRLLFTKKQLLFCNIQLLYYQLHHFPNPNVHKCKHTAIFSPFLSVSLSLIISHSLFLSLFHCVLENRSVLHIYVLYPQVRKISGKLKEDICLEAKEICSSFLLPFFPSLSLPPFHRLLCLFSSPPPLLTSTPSLSFLLLFPASSFPLSIPSFFTSLLM